MRLHQFALIFTLNRSITAWFILFLMFKCLENLLGFKFSSSKEELFYSLHFITQQALSLIIIFIVWTYHLVWCKIFDLTNLWVFIIELNSTMKLLSCWEYLFDFRGLFFLLLEFGLRFNLLITFRQSYSIKQQIIVFDFPKILSCFLN